MRRRHSYTTTVIMLICLASLLLVGMLLPSHWDPVVTLPVQPSATTTATVELKEATHQTPTAFLPSVNSDLPTETPALNVATEPTLPANLINVGADLQFDVFAGKDMKAEVASFKPLIEMVLGNSDYTGGVPLKASLAPSDVTVPVMEKLGPPCISGETSHLVGYDWLSHPLHFALDIACNFRGGKGLGNDWFIAAAPANTVVWAVINSESQAVVYNESGITILLKAKIPDGYNIQGNLIFGFGHLDTGGVYVQPGQQLTASQEIGEISRWKTTGNTNGPHTHYAVIWEKPGGALEFLNPHDWEALGTRQP
jgi:hypothetical protein